MNKFQNLFDSQFNYFYKTDRFNISERIENLNKIENWILAHLGEIRSAAFKDLRKPAPEVDMTEVLTVLSEIRSFRRKLKKWTRPHKVSRTLATLTARSWVQYEPLGIILIISPWNYPFILCVSPLVTALAAGNVCIIKPPEISPATSALIKNMVETLFTPEQVAVVEGGAETAKELLKLPFNHIAFTGSPAIGKHVMRAAAQHLASVTLELGGKSPVIIDQSADVNEAARIIAWGKCLNAGQTCMAPDYVYLHENIHTEFIEKLKFYIDKFYKDSNKTIKESDDYGRIIDIKHFNKIKSLFKDAVEKGAYKDFGGDSDKSEKYMAPTILTNINPDSDIMQEEIFGPLLPVINFNDIENVIKEINSKPKPLALYIFSKNKKITNQVIKNTSSGTVAVNDVVVQYTQLNLPFGGVNNSGIGKIHGFYGFEELSNKKAVFKNNKFSFTKMFYPPYTSGVHKLIKTALKYL